MKCETRVSCRNEAELWIHLNGRPKRSCVACSTRAISDFQVVESHWEAPLDGPCPAAEHRALTPTERADIIAAEDRAHGRAIPLPPPAEETVPRLPSSDPPSTAEPSEETNMGSKVLTLTLRPDADAHPELCRVAQCPYGDRKPRGLRRGICSADTETLRRRGIYDLFALPSTQGKAKPKAEMPLTPLTASVPDVVLSEGDALLPHGAAAVPVAMRADPPPAPPPPAADEGFDVPNCEIEEDQVLVALQAEIERWRELADVSGDALEAIADAMALQHDREAPIGPQLVDRATVLVQRNAFLEPERDEARRERDEARAARDRSQNELIALASEVKHLSRRAELAEDAATERRYELDTALQTYADLRAKLCQIFGEDPAELTDQGIVDKATMAQHWWGKTTDEFKAFRFAVAELVGVEEEMADPVYLRNVLRNALEQPVSYGPFRVDSAVCVPSGRNQATLTWAQGDARLLPVGSLVRLTVVEVLGG